MIKKIIPKILIIITLTSFNLKSFAQDSIFSIFFNEEYRDLVLPPIDSLFYYSEHNNNIGLYDYRILEQQTNIKTEQRAWLDHFRIGSAYQYGYVGAESLIQGYLIPAHYQTTQNAQNLSYIGVSFSFPISYIIDRNNKIKKQKYMLEQIKIEKEIKIEYQKFIIIDLYNKANECISLLNIKTEAKNYANILFTIGQKDFANGQINLNELSRIKHSESVASSEFETVRIELKICLMKLEILCNYKFPIIKNL